MLSAEDFTFFKQTVEPLLQHPDVWGMKAFIQHGDVSTLQHSIAVSYYSFLLSRKLGISCDHGALIRGALLHDFYLYDWHIPDKSHRLHGFTHPHKALFNAQTRFCLGRVECDIILKHMWPLTPRFPACREAWLVTLADKYCSLLETLDVSNPYRMLLRAHDGKLD